MAFLQNNYQVDPYTGETEEERRRRLAAAAASDEAVASGGAMATPMNFGDVAGSMFDQRMAGARDRIDQAAQFIMDPAEAIRQRRIQQQEEAANTEVRTQTVKTYGDGSQERIVKTQIPAQAQQVQAPVAPVQPQRFVQPRQISPEMANQQFVPPQLPQPGPAVQVASTQPNLPVTQAPKPAVQLSGLPTVEQMGTATSNEDLYQQAVINARNEEDPAKRRNAYAKLLADPNVSEGYKTMANRFIAEDYMRQRDMAKANQAIQEATPTDLARYMKEQKKEGSYVKAILLARLGLNDLAQKEQELINPTLTMSSAVDTEGKKYTVARDKIGNIVYGFDSTGKTVGQETIANLSAAAMPTKAFLLPQSAGGLMQKTIIGEDGKPQVITGQVFTDPQTNNTYFQAGNKRYDTTGLSTPAQNVQNVYSAAAAGAAGKAGGEGFTPQQLPAFPGQQGGPQASVPVAPVAAPAQVAAVDAGALRRAQSDVEAIDREIALTQRRPFGTPAQQQERIAILQTERAAAQQRLQQAQQMPAAPVTAAPTVTAPAANLPVPTAGMPVWQQRQNAALGQKQAEEKIQVAGKRSESFNKILDEEVRPQAQAGDTVSSVRKQQFAIFDRPGVDSNKLFGLYNAAQENPKDQKLAIVRDIFGGIFKPETEVSQRLALLNLNPQEFSALAEYNIANQRINAATLKQTAGPGSVSDAEQKANRESNVDPTKVPALGAYNAMAQSQFSGDLARYKADWAENHPATNALQLDKAWRKESQSLSELYGTIAKQRAQYIAGNGATTAAVREGYRRFPIPEYDPNTGTWKKTKPIAEILGK